MSTTPNDPYDSTGSAPPPPPEQAGGQQPPQYAQTPQQYQQYGQPQYAQPYGGQPGNTEKNWMGVTSLVLSILGFFTGITAIGGIVFGHLGLGAAKRGEADNRGMALAGVIIGYIIVVLSILAIIAILAFSGWLIGECGGSNPADWCTA
ncbi:DUF4190 domain-containing protein [Demequina sp.]|uniref:DUF4190 domain-containing protein n=1 Tax=Demequina sp. TaxID=2050685 RepID=UPI003A84C3D0